jgi:hypothetical protein
MGPVTMFRPFIILPAMITFLSYLSNFASTLCLFYSQTEIQAAGGIVTTEDINNYEPVIQPPLNVSFMGHTYIGVGKGIANSS